MDKFIIKVRKCTENVHVNDVLSAKILQVVRQWSFIMGQSCPLLRGQYNYNFRTWVWLTWRTINTGALT